MKENLKEAVRLLGAYTARRYRIWELAGKAKASCRAHIMSALIGKKTSQAKSGVYALREEFYKHMEIGGEQECSAIREDLFISQCRNIASD